MAFQEVFRCFRRKCCHDEVIGVRQVHRQVMGRALHSGQDHCRLAEVHLRLSSRVRQKRHLPSRHILPTNVPVNAWSYVFRGIVPVDLGRPQRFVRNGRAVQSLRFENAHPSPSCTQRDIGARKPDPPCHSTSWTRLARPNLFINGRVIVTAAMRIRPLPTH